MSGREKSVDAERSSPPEEIDIPRKRRLVHVIDSTLALAENQYTRDAKSWYNFDEEFTPSIDPGRETRKSWLGLVS